MENIKKILEDSNKKSKMINDASDKIVLMYSNDLDKTIKEIDDLVSHGEIDNIPSERLENYCIKIPSFLYYMASGMEEIGTKMDILSQEKKNAYNRFYLSEEGTAQERKSKAELGMSDYVLTYMVYKRAYSCLREKSEAAGQLYDAIKKILTKRIAENDLSRHSGS